MGGTSPDVVICTACHQVGWPSRESKGSAAVAILLLLFFFIPGVIYLAWMGSSRRPRCAACGGDVIPVDTPRARTLLGEQWSAQVEEARRRHHIAGQDELAKTTDSLARIFLAVVAVVVVGTVALVVRGWREASEVEENRIDWAAVAEARAAREEAARQAPPVYGGLLGCQEFAPAVGDVIVWQLPPEDGLGQKVADLPDQELALLGMMFPDAVQVRTRDGALGWVEPHELGEVRILDAQSHEPCE